MDVRPDEHRDEPPDIRLVRFLEAKRDSFPPSAGFGERVMASLRPGTEASPRRRAPATLAGLWRRFLRGWRIAPAPRMLWATASLGLAAAILAVLPLVPGDGPTRSGAGTRPESLRIKGGDFRFVFVVRDGDNGTRRVGERERLTAGDRIQVLYWLDDSSYVQLLSLDRKGVVQCYSCGNPGSRLAPGAGHPLPFALELDATPGWELFILAASAAPVEGAALEAALREAWEDAGRNPRKVEAWLERGLPGVRFKAFLVRKGERA